MLHTEHVQCPYCGESFEITVDTSAGSQEYTEDCQICCRPIVFHSAVDLDGNLADLSVMREDD